MDAGASKALTGLVGRCSNDDFDPLASAAQARIPQGGEEHVHRSSLLFLNLFLCCFPVTHFRAKAHLLCVAVQALESSFNVGTVDQTHSE